MEERMKIGIYPGSFDPFTMGHLHIVREAARLFDTLYIGVLVNRGKQPVFTAEERVSLIETALRAEGITNVVCETFDGLLVNYCRLRNAEFIVRGLRATSDFEYEFQLDAVNRHLAPEVKTVYFMAAPEHSFLSSSNVKEMGFWGGSIHGLVPESIEDIITERLKHHE